MRVAWNIAFDINTVVNDGYFNNCRFVHFATLREAENAITKLHMTDMGDGLKLRVKVAEDETSRERRLSKKREEESFLGTLHCGKASKTSCEEADDEDLLMGDKEWDEVQCPKKHSEADNPISSFPSGLPLRSSASFGSSEKANRLPRFSSPSQSKLMPPSHFTSSKCVNGEGEPSRSTDSRCGQCERCGIVTSKKCAACKSYFCSTDCQAASWPEHRTKCTQKEVNGKDVSSSISEPEPLKIAENSEDEGFVINLPDDDDLDTLSSSLKQANLSTPDQQQSTLPCNPLCSVPNLSQEKGRSLPLETDSFSSPVETQSLPASSNNSYLQRLRTESIEPAVSQVNAGQERFCGTLYSDILSAFSGFESRASSFSLNDPPPTFFAFPTAIVSSHQFSIVPFSLQCYQSLQKLSEFEKSSPTSFIGEEMISQNKLYGMVDKQGCCMRVQMGNNSRWSACDSGKAVICGSHSLFSLPEDIAMIPSLRIRASFRDVTTVRDNADEGRQFLLNHLLGKVIRIMNSHCVHSHTGFDILVCDVESLDGKISFCDHMLEKGYVKPFEKRTEISRRPSGFTKTQDHGRSLLSSRNAREDNFKSLSANASAAPIDSEVAIEHNGVGRQNDKEVSTDDLGKKFGLVKPIGFRCLHESSKVPFHAPPMDFEFEMYSTVVLSPYIIWAQIVHQHSHKLKALLEDMNACYQHTKNNSYVPKVGHICAARFNVDGMFYRAEILRVNENGLVDVMFVDYGNRETVKLTELRLIKSIFLTLPKQALLFSLAGIAPVPPSTKWSEESCKLLKQLIFETPVRVKIAHCDLRVGKAAVFITDPSDPKRTLNDMFVERGLATAYKSKPFEQRIGNVSFGRGSVFNMVQNPRPGHSNNNVQRYVSIDSTTESFPNTSGPNQNSLSNDVSRKMPDTGAADTRGTFSGQESDTHVKKRNYSARNTSRSYQNNGEGDKKRQFLSARTKKPFSQASAEDNRPDSSASRDLPERSIEHSPLVQKSHSASPLCTIPPTRISDTVPVIVSHISDPHHFYVQVINEAMISKFARMSEELQVPHHTPLVGVSKGKFCVAKYEEDNSYNRACVVRVTRPTATVFFLDFGNVEEVPLNQLYELDQQFMELPKQAVLCSLSGVSNPCGKEELWDVRACEMFKQLALNKEGTVIKNGEDSDQVLIQLTVKSEDGPIINVGARLLEKKVVLPEQNSHPASYSPVTYSAPSFDTIPSLELNSSQNYITVAVSEVISPAEVYVQFVSQIEVLSDLNSSLNHNLKDVIPQLCQLELNSVCCTKFIEDGVWYRARVLNITPDAYLLQFIDYGNCEVVNLDEVAPCPAEFLTVPVQAVCCSIADIAPLGDGWDPEATMFLKTFCKDKLLSMAVVEHTVENTTVRLVDTTTSEDKDVSSELIKLGLVSGPGTMSPDNSAALFKLAPCSHTFGNDFEPVTITEVVSPLSFWVQLASMEIQSQLRTIQSSLNTACRKVTRSTSHIPVMDDFCCALFSEDKNWYRAQVVEVSQQKAKVVFVDFGNTDFVDFVNIHPLPSDIATIPRLAYHVSLMGIASLSANATQVLIKLTADKVLCLKVTDPSSNEPFLVELIDTSQKTDINIAEELVRLGSALSTPAVQFPTVMTSSLEHMSLPTTPDFKASVTHIESPISIFIQVYENNMDSLKNLLEMVESFSADAPTITGQVRRGQLVLAPFDGEYFRAILVGKNEDQFVVRFVDFGNKTKVSRCDLRPVSKSICAIPIQALKCSLVGINPLDPVPNLKSVVDQVVLCTAVCFEPLLIDLKTKDGRPVVDSKLSGPQVFYYLPFMELPPQPTSVVVTEIVNPYSFYVQIFDHTTALELSNLSKQLQQICPTLTPLSSAVIGQLCCAIFSQDNCWYRARVTEVQDEHVKVVFVDYGNTDEIPFSSLRSIPEKFLRLPAQCISCCLASADSLIKLFPSESIQIFKDLTTDVQPTATFKRLNERHQSLVVLKDGSKPEGEDDIYQLLVQSLQKLKL